MLFKAAELVDEMVIGIKAQEHLEKFKVYEMLLAQYLRNEKMELFQQETKLSMEI